MACGCNGASAGRASRSARVDATRTESPPTSNETVAAAAASVVYLEVFRNGRSTGRRFTSLLAAEQAKVRLGGDEIRPVG